MVYIGDNSKKSEVRWIDYLAKLGILYCECGKDNNFNGVLNFTCSNCGKSHSIEWSQKKANAKMENDRKIIGKRMGIWL